MQRRPADQGQGQNDLQAVNLTLPDYYIEQGFQAGIRAAERHFQEVTLPINAKINDLLMAISSGIDNANMLAARIAGIDQIQRQKLKMTAQFIYDYYYQLDSLLAKQGSEMGDSLRSSIMEFHSAIMDYVTGRDSGERLLQCALMQREESLKIREQLATIRFGGTARDEVNEYLGEQLEKLMRAGMSQQEAVWALRKRLKDERQYIPDHRLEFPKAQALDILLEPYNQNNNRFKLMRKRYRDQISKIDGVGTGSDTK